MQYRQRLSTCTFTVTLHIQTGSDSTFVGPKRFKICVNMAQRPSSHHVQRHFSLLIEIDIRRQVAQERIGVQGYVCVRRADIAEKMNTEQSEVNPAPLCVLVFNHGTDSVHVSSFFLRENSNSKLFGE